MYVIGVVLVGTNGATYVYRVHASLDMVDVRGGFIKALVFSAIVSSACCFRGHFCHMRTDGYGAKSVGFATISAVVISCVTILISDYVLTSFLM
jgi:phospholipid/cholesterol/gamma-HCH transport system permease protein